MIQELQLRSFTSIALAVVSLLASGCVVNGGDGDDDDAGEASADGDSGSADSAGSGPADDGGTDATPQDGAWHYTETGQTTNACTFLEEPTNGNGTFALENTGPGTFVITPGDGTAPFECSLAGSAIQCAERLQDTLEVGPGATGSVIVGITGELQSATAMTGSQQGRIECEGADCATIAAAYGVTFPCTFDVPFDAAAD